MITSTCSFIIQAIVSSFKGLFSYVFRPKFTSRISESAIYILKMIIERCSIYHCTREAVFVFNRNISKEIEEFYGLEKSDVKAFIERELNEDDYEENERLKEAGGIYIFDTRENAEAYLDIHSKRLESFGIDKVNAKIFDTNDELTKITNGPAL